MAFREAGFVGSEDERDVGEDRHGGSKCMILQDLLGRIRDVVGSPDDVGEAHVDVVSDDAEVIGGNAVGAKEDEVLDFGIGEFDSAKNGVVEGG